MGRPVDQPTTGLTDRELEGIWRSLELRAVPDPRFFLYAESPAYRASIARTSSESTESQIIFRRAITRCDEARAERRRLDSLPPRERILAFVDYCQDLGDPYARRSRHLARRVLEPREPN